MVYLFSCKLAATCEEKLIKDIHNRKKRATMSQRIPSSVFLGLFLVIVGIFYIFMEYIAVRNEPGIDYAHAVVLEMSMIIGTSVQFAVYVVLSVLRIKRSVILCVMMCISAIGIMFVVSIWLAPHSEAGQINFGGWLGATIGSLMQATSFFVLTHTVFSQTNETQRIE